MRRSVLIIFACCLILATLVESKGDKHSGEDKKGKEGGHSGENKKVAKGVHNSKGSGEDKKGKDSKEDKGHNHSGEKNSKEHKGKHPKGGKNSNESKGPKGSGESGENKSGGGNLEKHSVSLKFYSTSTAYYTYNEKTQTVSYLDFENKLSLYYCGKTGAAFIFSHQGHGVYIYPDSTDKTWLAEKQKFEEYFKKGHSTTELYKLGLQKGFVFTGEYIESKIEKRLKAVLVTQSVDYSSTCKAFSHAMATSETTTLSVKGFDGVFGTVQGVQMRDDARWFRGVSQGLTTFSKNFDGGYEALKKANVKLSLQKVLQAESGDAVLILLLQGIASKSDLVKAAGKQINSEVRFFHLLGILSGKTTYGYGGFLKVVNVCVRYAYGEISEWNVNYVLRQYFTSKRAVQINYEEKWGNTIKTLVKVIKVDLELDQQYGDIIKILEGIQQKKWEVKGINMYEVITVIWGEKFGNKQSADKVWAKLKKKSKQ